jgi:thioredoxin-related protein
MKVQLYLLLICLPLLSNSQEEKGIRFEQGLSWQEVLEKAKSENKFIFVDCFATWCAPCKQMDKEVYSNDTIGDYINKAFISVKVQLDTTQNDNEHIKRWYATAHDISRKYKINALPAYLFFAPNGEAVHKDVGAKDVEGFIALATDATDSSKQYYTLLKKYQQGKLDYPAMPHLANAAVNFNENDLALQIAGDYIHNYLNKLSDSQLVRKDHLVFMSAFASVLTSKDKIFNLCYYHPDVVDKAIESKGFAYAAGLVNYIIYKEEVSPVLDAVKEKGTGPDWEMINEAIKAKYNSYYAERNTVDAKVRWYREKEDWKNYTRHLVQQADFAIKNNDARMNDFFYLNSTAWDVFQYSKNKSELRKALLWIERAISLTPKDLLAAIIDTKANLLYKLGRTEEAITLEEQAITLSPEPGEFLKNIDKMKKGIPTWP